MNAALRMTLMAAAMQLLLAICSFEQEPANSIADSSLPDEPLQSQVRFVTIVTGSISGIYYPAGGAVASTVNAARKTHNLCMVVEDSHGSVANIEAVMEGRAAFGIAQSDRQFQAYHGFAEWEESGGWPALRSLMSLHAENVVLVAAADAGIHTLRDLAGKRVNIGNTRSGHRRNAIDALTRSHIDPSSDFIASDYKVEKAAILLQQGTIDAFFYTVGHPNAALLEATTGKRRVTFVPIDNVFRIMALHPYYSRSRIPLRFYPRVQRVSKEDVSTFGVRATLITSLSVPERVVYAVVREVMENLDHIRSRHPALEALEKETMLRNLSAPLHPGARRYYEEVGML